MGGVETHCQRLYPRLASSAHGFDVVIYGRTPYVGRDPYEYAGVQVSPIWTVRNVLFETILHTVLCVLRARFADRADVLHIHAVGPALATPLARLLGMRVVATHHGGDYARDKWGPISRTMLRLGETLMLRFAHRVISVGRSAAAAMAAKSPATADRITFIPNGAALPDASQDLSVLEELGVTPGGYILAVGRLVPEKGFDILIDAAGRTVRGRVVVIVGGDDHAGGYSRQLKARASDRVVFAGVRRGGALRALYAHAALFVLPSRHEGLPIVALEALLAGAPVLLSDITPNVDIGLPRACYAPVGDVAALAAVLDQPDFEAQRPDDPALIAQYDWDRIAAATARVIRAAAR